MPKIFNYMQLVNAKFIPLYVYNFFKYMYSLQILYSLQSEILKENTSLDGLKLKKHIKKNLQFSS